MKRRLFAVVAVALALATPQLVAVQPASAWPGSTVNLFGHGYGHGRGMSQYGALGYAIDHNWNHDQILQHYYSNTSYGVSAGDPTIGVRITGNDGIDMIVTAGVPFNLNGRQFPANSAARVQKSGGSFVIQYADNCGGGGGWRDQTAGGTSVIASSNAPGDALANMMQLCMPSATRGYRGNLQAVLDNGTARVVNNLPTQQYLRGVVPRESPASWADLGGGKGAHALRAQAVAARSYMLSAPSYSYATTCDTTACQVYGGAYLNGAYIEDPRSDAAIAATNGQVRRFDNGTIARTEFSSSSGGYTAGGTFPAVRDDGDAYSGNPNYSWSVSIPVSSVEGAYAVGSLQNISINSRNNVGDLGGRVLSMTISGTGGSVTDTGAGFRAKLGLKSDWFRVSGTPSGGINGYYVLGNDGGVFSFGAASFYGSMGGRPLNSPMIQMVTGPGSAGYWLLAGDGGIFTYGTAKFFGSMGGKPLNRPVVGMAPTPTGNGYWLVASDGGIFAFGDARFYGSMGGQRLNKPIVGMAASPTGNGYWLVASDGGIFAFGDAPFYGSTGSIKLNRPIVAMSATPNGGGYWLLAEDGGIFAYGNAPYYGSLPGSKVSATATSMFQTATGAGYVILSDKGVVHSYGDAPQFGDMPSVVPNFRGRALDIALTYG